MLWKRIISYSYAVCHALVRPERWKHHVRNNQLASSGGTYLEGQPEGLVGRPAGGHDGVEGLEQGHAAGLALLPLDGPALRERRVNR